MVKAKSLIIVEKFILFDCCLFVFRRIDVKGVEKEVYIARIWRRSGAKLHFEAPLIDGSYQVDWFQETPGQSKFPEANQITGK